MSFEIPGFQPGVFVADADMAGNQYTCVKLTANSGEITACTVASEAVFAILQDEPRAGESAHIMMTGISRGIAGGVLAVNDYWSTDANGAIVANNAPAATDVICGKVLTPAAGAGEYVAVTIGMQPHSGAL